MSLPPVTFSDDQAAAYDSIAEMLKTAGVDLDDDALLKLPGNGKSGVMAVIGKAGSGKTLLAGRTLQGAGRIRRSDRFRRFRKPQSAGKAQPCHPCTHQQGRQCLRLRGVPATTIHRILYTPVYDPEYERIAEWLAGNDERPEIEGLTDEALDRAAAFYANNKSIPGALAAAGLRGSDFITGWKRRDEPLDIGFVDEASMLDDRQFEDLQEIFPTLVAVWRSGAAGPGQSIGQHGL